MKPLCVLTGSVTSAEVPPGTAVVTTTGIMVVSGAAVVADRANCTVGSGTGRMVGGSTTGTVGTVGSGFVGQGPLSL